jgi:hypothetical protein
MTRSTFSPEVCSVPVCAEDRRPAGLNVGILVLGPTAERFAALTSYAVRVQHSLRLANESADPTVYSKRATKYLGSSEQSFIRSFFADEENVSLVAAHEVRAGWNWTVRTYVEPTVCDLRRKRDPTHHCVPGTAHVMSRLYNARPMDCARCPGGGAYEPKIVHYACTLKPWQRTRHAWAARSWCHGSAEPAVSCAPCLSRLAERWYVAQERACEALLVRSSSSAAIGTAGITTAADGDASREERDREEYRRTIIGAWGGQSRCAGPGAQHVGGGHGMQKEPG